MKGKINRLVVLIALVMALVGCNAPKPPAAPTAIPTDEPTMEPAQAGPTETQQVTETALPVTPTVADLPAPTEAPLLQVIKPDGAAFSFSTAELKRIDRGKVYIEGGKVVDGPKVSQILAAAGITTFTQVTYISTDGSSSTMPKAQINDRVILYFTNNGILKLAATGIPKSEWVSRVFQIKVQ
jgi:hypothetical protein